MWKLQPDYTADVRRPTKWFAVVLLMAAAFASSGCLAVCVAAAIIRPKGLPVSALVGSLAIFALFSWASVWMLIRVLRDARAANARTTMPEWFIQVFGAFVLVGLFIVAFTARQPLLLVEGLGVALAMLGIRRLLNAPDNEATKS
jgi:hypothetical protein